MKKEHYRSIKKESQGSSLHSPTLRLPESPSSPSLTLILCLSAHHHHASSPSSSSLSVTVSLSAETLPFLSATSKLIPLSTVHHRSATAHHRDQPRTTNYPQRGSLSSDSYRSSLACTSPTTAKRTGETKG
ncbi:hypothetical protein RJT34_30413 [Clitoria ternatea]|uniref:Uncharacterized protein n=1 Tax=Clitoria ternatea TaxID=43366 RepID=A0AAN9ESB5_CLITE